MSKLGYACGVFDIVHGGHINLLRNAKALCDKLIVGVSTDELVISYKNKKPIIQFSERIEIVRSIKYVDCAVSQYDLDNIEAYDKLKYNILFVGDDHFREKVWNTYEDILMKFNVEVIYLPYTSGVSSTILRERMIYG